MNNTSMMGHGWTGEGQVVDLHRNPWVTLRQVRKPDDGVYVYAHESRCDGHVVAVLPFRDTERGRDYLVRLDVTPCWGFEPELVSITGGCEAAHPDDDAVREVDEEAGYTITKQRLIRLGLSYGSKAVDTVYHLYAVDVSELEQGPALGDGSRIEAEGSTVWLAAKELARVPDPQVALIWFRLQMYRQGDYVA